MRSTNFTKRTSLACGAALAVWMALVAEWAASGPLADALRWLGFTTALCASLVAAVVARRTARPVARSIAYTVVYMVVWQWLMFGTNALGWDELRVTLANCGLGVLFMVGLGWVVWGVERSSRHFQSRRALPIAWHERHAPHPFVAEAEGRRFSASGAPPKRIWNALDPDAWYYGRRGKKLAQSTAALGSYSLAFLLLTMLLSQLRGCQEIYEMPAGGGVQQTIAQTVQVQKRIKKKFVINPFSSIIFNPPPIDDVKLQLTEATSHRYTVGYGQGTGAGFSGGTGRGKVRFIRLEYAGGDWDQDFGVGADVNMLIEYGVRTSHAVAERTESRTVSELGNFAVGKSPPLVYLTGQRNITLSKSEAKTLREYLLEKQGMIFGDNGGSYHFHNQFVAMMRQVLPDVDPVRVPLDDVIHRIPFAIPFLPYVAPHGGKDALGWKVDGRWVCYYHPGDIGDAWTDDHSGVKPEIWEACYQLGTNVIFYAHAEYNKWLEARQKK